VAALGRIASGALAFALTSLAQDMTAATISPPNQLVYTRARYIRLVRFSFLILIGRFVTLEP
jgi:hypothetical protein